MEGISKKTVATSKLFRFFVGPDRQEFTIHSALAAHHSAFLELLVQGSFRESTDGFVDWGDIDERTFTSFWQYIYTGDYDNPEPISTTASSIGVNLNDSQHQTEEAPVYEIHKAPEPEPEVAYDYPEYGRGTLTKREMLWKDFRDSWRVDLSVHAADKAPEERPKVHAKNFMHHAKVYVLADRYVINHLMNVSFDKLHRALVEDTVSESRLNDIVALLRYCYTELVPDTLKQLVVHYAACKVEKLWNSAEFQELLEDCGSLSKTLIGSLLLRLD